jgi:hypothetical protein
MKYILSKLSLILTNLDSKLNGGEISMTYDECCTCLDGLCEYLDVSKFSEGSTHSDIQLKILELVEIAKELNERLNIVENPPI